MVNKSNHNFNENKEMDKIIINVPDTQGVTLNKEYNDYDLSENDINKLLKSISLK